MNDQAQMMMKQNEGSGTNDDEAKW